MDATGRTPSAREPAGAGRQKVLDRNGGAVEAERGARRGARVARVGRRFGGEDAAQKALRWRVAPMRRTADESRSRAVTVPSRSAAEDSRRVIAVGRRGDIGKWTRGIKNDTDPRSGVREGAKGRGIMSRGALVPDERRLRSITGSSRISYIINIFSTRDTCE